MMRGKRLWSIGLGLLCLVGCSSGNGSAATDRSPLEPTTTTPVQAATSTTTPTPPPTTTSTTTTTTITNPPQLSLCGEPATCWHPMVDEAVWDLPVLSIRFLSDDDDDGIVDFETTGFDGTVDQLRSRIESLDVAGAWWMTEATRYRRSPGEPPPSLGYRIVDVLEFDSGVPRGQPVSWNEGWFRPDYLTLLEEVDVCAWVDGLGVREVWMWSQHHGNIEPAESNMWSPVGDISNSERTDDLPGCEHSYTLYNFNFTRGVAEMLHNHGHQAEALFGRGDPHLFWDEFVGARTSEGGLEEPLRCGWTHTPPNGVVHYDIFNERTVEADCLEWDPDGGPVSEISCSVWFEAVYGDPRCFEDRGLAFTVWWFQGVPGLDNALTYRGTPLINWWLLFADLEAVMDAPSWLLEG